MSSASPLQMTPEEFYAWEEQQPVKHQYYRGEVFSMAGTSVDHNRICRSIWNGLADKLKGTKCEAFAIDLMVHTADGLNTYPDVFIVCGAIEYDDQKTRVVTNPRVIFEVLSPSTEKYDRDLKFDHYRSIPSFEEYILVSQNRAAVDHFRRGEAGAWIERRYRNLDEVLQLESIKAALPLSQIFDGLVFPPPEDPNVAQLKIYGDDR